MVASYIAAAVKAKVTLIEGGDCLNNGCAPSKALICSTRLLAQLSRSAEFGINDIKAEFKFANIMELVQRIVKTVAPHDSIERYRQLGVDVVIGKARIMSSWKVEVTESTGTRTITTLAIVIAAGARPFVPPIPSIENIGYLTSDNVWELREQPKRMVVLGDGPIGCELAQCFARLGVQVTQVKMATRLLIREDNDVSDCVAARFSEEGIDVCPEHTAKQFVIKNGEKILIAEHWAKKYALLLMRYWWLSDALRIPLVMALKR